MTDFPYSARSCPPYSHLIEKYGSGIKRIREGFVAYGLKEPKFENFQHGFRVVVYGEPLISSEKTVGEMVRGTAGRILQYMKENPNVTREELSGLLSLSIRRVEYHIKKLKDASVIKRIGSTKSGRWKANN